VLFWNLIQSNLSNLLPFSKWLITRISNLKSRDTKNQKNQKPANQNPVGQSQSVASLGRGKTHTSIK